MILSIASALGDTQPIGRLPIAIPRGLVVGAHRVDLGDDAPAVWHLEAIAKQSCVGIRISRRPVLHEVVEELILALDPIARHAAHREKEGVIDTDVTGESHA